MHISPCYVLPCILTLFPTTTLLAQDMVTEGVQDGLMKTISYDVSRFIDIRDKKLQDVMVKMPGLQGSETGGGYSFTYNGMTIGRYYVNGLDVLEGNSQPVLNLKPEDVERIEITENFVTIAVMRGKTYSNNVAINVVLKDTASGKWSGSVKALGGIPGVGTLDINGLNLGPKFQTTVMVKGDMTGLDFTAPLHGFGDYGSASDLYDEDKYVGLEGVSGGFDYNLRRFQDVVPSLAPLSSERVRFSNSAVAQVGSSYKLSDTYNLNVQLTLHGNRLTANSLDETTYYMDNSAKDFVSDEDSKAHQYDLQSAITLLSNTEEQFLRNKLIFNYRHIDILSDITGSTPNLHDMHTNPIYLKNDFSLKRPFGENVLSVNATAGYNSRPQDLLMNQYETDGKLLESMDQSVNTTSSYIDVGTKFDISLGRYTNLAFRVGTAYNSRLLKTDLERSVGESNYIDDKLTILNVFGGAALTFINDRVQAELQLPLIYGNYDWTSGIKTRTTQRDNTLCFYPSLNVKYDFTPRLSLSTVLKYNQSPLDRKRIFSGMVIQDFKRAMGGYPNISKDEKLSGQLQATYRLPEHSFFINGSVEATRAKDAFLSIMKSEQIWMVQSYMLAPDDHHSSKITETVEINKGISYLKGKIGLKLTGTQAKSNLVRGESLLPYSTNTITIAPYVNGRLASWCNVIYKLEYNQNHMQMGDMDRTSTQSYQQSLELIVSPWDKLNVSILGEHYYTEFTDDLSKHLVLADFKAEYNLNDRWQLLLSATNILNQKTYNYTLVDSETFTRSFTSYAIRDRNILLGFFYKF